jgi:CHASE2 domain-containing sensor protein
MNDKTAVNALLKVSLGIDALALLACIVGIIALGWNNWLPLLSVLAVTNVGVVVMLWVVLRQRR